MNLKLTPVGLFLSAAAVVHGAEPPTDKYWKAVAEHFAAVAAFETSLTPEQKVARRNIEEADKHLAEARTKMAAGCANGLDESGPEPVCAKAAPSADPPKAK